MWEKVWNFILGLPGLEKFGNLPWWLGILFRGCENVKYLKIFKKKKIHYNLNVTQNILIFDENVCRRGPLKNTSKFG